MGCAEPRRKEATLIFPFSDTVAIGASRKTGCFPGTNTLSDSQGQGAYTPITHFYYDSSYMVTPGLFLLSASP